MVYVFFKMFVPVKDTLSSEWRIRKNYELETLKTEYNGNNKK